MSQYARQHPDEAPIHSVFDKTPQAPAPQEPEPCDHEWQFRDESFDHEFGCEQVHFWECDKCGATTNKCPHPDPDEP